MGDTRSGRELLAEGVADEARTIRRLAGSAEGARLFEGLASAATNMCRRFHSHPLSPAGCGGAASDLSPPPPPPPPPPAAEDGGGLGFGLSGVPAAQAARPVAAEGAGECGAPLWTALPAARPIECAAAAAAAVTAAPPPAGGGPWGPPPPPG
jgi:hypothetical protein